MFALQGTVLAVSPDSNSVVLSDPTRQIITIYNSVTPAVVSTFTGIGTRAVYTPDGDTLYVTTADNHLLVYSAFTSWQSYDLSATGANDVAIAIPSVGAFVGGNTAINAHSYCANANVTPTIFYPQAASTTVSAAVGDRVAATNDGMHLLDVRLAASGGTPVVNDVTFPDLHLGRRPKWRPHLQQGAAHRRLPRERQPAQLWHRREYRRLHGSHDHRRHRDLPRVRLLNRLRYLPAGGQRPHLRNTVACVHPG